MYNSKNDFIIAGCVFFVENIADETICYFNFSNKKPKKLESFVKLSKNIIEGLIMVWMP